MKFCVIGAGSGGRAMASYISSKNRPVNLYNRSPTRLVHIKKKNSIQTEGILSGTYTLNLLTQNLESAIKGVDVIMVVTPAFAHKSIAHRLAPFLREGQIIILNPGRTFGSIEFIRAIEEVRGRVPVFVGETQTLLFTSREGEKNKVNILKIKNSVNFSCFPEIYTNIIYQKLKDIFPQLIPINNYLEVTLNNIGMVLHPAITLLNSGAIESGRKFMFYKQGAPKRICKILNKIEDEINEIFNHFGLNHLKFCDWAEKSYGINASCIHEALQKIESYKNIYSPDKLITRYLLEDVPMGLIPISSLGKFLNIPTPTVDSIIQLSKILCGDDFENTGRTIEKLRIKKYIMGNIENAELTKSFQFKKKIRSSF